MAKKTSEVKKIIRSYVKELESLGIRVEKIILYGSFATGASGEDSDIDLLVISDDFERMNLRERLEALGIAAAHIRQPIQAVGYTRGELKDIKKGSFLEEIFSSKTVHF